MAMRTRIVALGRALAISSSPHNSVSSAFSTSASSNGNEPSTQQSQPLLTGMAEFLQTVQRCRARKHVFDQYKTQNVFQPSPWAGLNNWFLFYHLNRPQNLHSTLDMVEFLDGAKHALEATMMAMYSREFANFAVGAIDKSEYADQLRASLEPVSLDALQQFIKYTEDAGIRTEMQRLDIHAAYLVGAQYHRVARRPSTNASGVQIVDAPVDERIRIQVCFEITEHVNVKLPEDDEPELLKKENVSIWQFESVVNSPETIDWMIEPLNLVSGA
uniref:Uncharacterized protein n=1 Tax=Globisporangium ultimum (strain ATCC 200006 / CBS 805.95 / DAOM BR144) TaxID=431595 RepID=K3WT52_GLOUD